MSTASVNGIELEYDTFGDPSNPTLLLIMGLGAQMISWDPGFIAYLVDAGLHVVRFDNRDVGLSSKIEGGPQPDIIAALTTGDSSTASYTLDDMADDAAGLLDVLGVERAHIVGASMGGFISQTLAIRHPERVLSLCSIMSSTGNRTVGQATGEAAALLVGPRPTTPDEAADAAVRASKVFGSKGLPVDEDRVRRLARQAFERMAYPAGFARQLLAVVASGDRTERLGSIDMPTVVIHGTDDGLVQPDGGEATAKAIPGAELVMIEGMGHDLPPSAWPQVTEAILTNIERAGTSA